MTEKKKASPKKKAVAPKAEVAPAHFDPEAALEIIQHAIDQIDPQGTGMAPGGSPYYVKPVLNSLISLRSVFTAEADS